MLFTPRLLHLEGHETTKLRAPGLFGQRIYIIPRGDCSFRRMRMAGTGREAKAAAQLKAKNEALPDENGCRLVMDSSAQIARSTTPMAGIWNFPMSGEFKGRYLPETLAQIPHSHGQRLVRGLSGFEGQIWEDSNLMASRWWGRQPTDADWDGFVRAAQESLGPLDMPRPAAVEVPWRQDIPVFEIDRTRASEIFSPLNIGSCIALGLACAAIYISGQYLRETLALNRVQAKALDIRADTEQIQSQRRRAMANMNYVRKYRSLGSNGMLLSGLSAVSTVLGDTDLGISQMGLRPTGLELQLKGEDEISVPEIVTALENQPALSNVNISLGLAGAVIVKAELSSPAAPAPSTADSSAKNPAAAVNPAAGDAP